MNYPTTVLKNAMAKLQGIQEKNKQLSYEKKNFVYSKIPQIRSYNSEISAILKSSLGDEVSSEELIKRVAELLKKKNKLLVENGFESDALENVYNCKKCNDEGFIDGKVCECYEKILRDEAYKLSNLEEKTKTQNFGTYNINVFSEPEKMRVIYEYSLKFCKEEKNIKNNLCFLGNQGTGKTFLSSCIAKNFLDNKKSVLYLTSVKLSDILDNKKFSKKSDEEAEDYIDFIRECDLLIIDDLGTECSMPYSQSQIFDILETRTLSNKRNLISTNLSLEELATKYSSRFTSRLIENFQILFFGEEDIRLKNSIS